MRWLKEPVSGLSHLFAALAALAGLVALLIISRGDALKQISLFIYGASLVLMLGSSATYHLVRASPRVTLILRRIDHAAIYLLIAGTYTPICINLFSGFWRWGLLGMVWTLAIFGIISKAFWIGTRRWVAVLTYLGMGWLSLLGIREILAVFSKAAIGWLVAGGLAFSLGAVIYATRKLDFWPGKFGFHEVWHIFVILGCLAHFIVIAFFVAPVTPIS